MRINLKKNTSLFRQDGGLDKCLESLFHTAVNNGYVTGYAGALCNYNELEIEDVVLTCLPPHDHKLAFCDPNVFDGDNPYSFVKGQQSFIKMKLKKSKPQNELK